MQFSQQVLPSDNNTTLKRHGQFHVTFLHFETTIISFEKEKIQSSSYLGKYKAHQMY